MDLARFMVLYTQEYNQIRGPFELYGVRLGHRDTAITRAAFQRTPPSVVPTTALPVARLIARLIATNDWFGIAHPCGRGLSPENRLERCFQAARYRTCLQASVRNVGLLRE